jgi:hypothetical protein
MRCCLYCYDRTHYIRDCLRPGAVGWQKFAGTQRNRITVWTNPMDRAQYLCYSCLIPRSHAVLSKAVVWLDLIRHRGHRFKKLRVRQR